MKWVTKQNSVQGEGAEYRLITEQGGLKRGAIVQLGYSMLESQYYWGSYHNSPYYWGFCHDTFQRSGGYPDRTAAVIALRTGKVTFK